MQEPHGAARLVDSEQRNTAQCTHPGEHIWVALGEGYKNKSKQCLLKQETGVGKRKEVLPQQWCTAKAMCPHLLQEVGAATEGANIPNLKSLNLKCSKT